jgi:hypothetical protein
MAVRIELLLGFPFMGCRTSVEETGTISIWNTNYSHVIFEAGVSKSQQQLNHAFQR